MSIPVVDGRPPVYERAKKAFKLTDEIINKLGVVFAYESAIWNPSGHKLPANLVMHEAVHLEQQAALGCEEWWDRYLNDAKFRLEQEVPAYRAQYQYAKKTWADRNSVAKLLDILAKELSGHLYGYVIGYTEALRKISL